LKNVSTICKYRIISLKNYVEMLINGIGGFGGGQGQCPKTPEVALCRNVALIMATRMDQNIRDPKIINNLWGGTMPSPHTPPLMGKGYPLPYPTIL